MTARDLSLTSSDGLALEAYEVPHEQPRGAVIFLTGIHNPSVTAFYGHAKMLHGLQKPFIDLYLRSQYGKDLMSLTPVESIALLGEKPALLMHSTGDSQVPFENFKRLTARAPGHVQTWTVEGDNHFILPDDGFWRPYDHEEYKTVILDFLNRHIGRLDPWSIAS